MITFTFFVGSPIFEDGLTETSITIHKDDLAKIDFYIEYIIEDNCNEYIILRDGIPYKWAMTDCKGDTYEGY